MAKVLHTSRSSGAGECAGFIDARTLGEADRRLRATGHSEIRYMNIPCDQRTELYIG